MVGGIFKESVRWEQSLSESQPAPLLREAFVDAYPVYVASLLVDRGIRMNVVVADAIVEGTAVLDGLLTTLEGTPFPDQRVSPLELFREALRPVDKALAVSDIPEPANVQSITVAPWDRYALSPGSSQVLGDAAHDAHLRWAVTKAAAIAPGVLKPAIFLAPVDEAPPEVTVAVQSVGYRVVRELSPSVSVAVVAASLPGAHSLVSEAVGMGLFTVVYGDDIDDLAAMGLRALGAAAIVSEARLVLEPAEILPIST